MARVVVIGAGVGGLAAAARLAAAGHEVTVYERSDTVGGKLGRHVAQTPAGAFRFDTGPSLLTLPQVFADLFEATGAKLDEYVDLVPLDPIVRHVFRRRHRARLLRRTRRVRRPHRRRARRRGGRRLAAALAAGRTHLGRRPGGTSCAGRSTPRWTLARLAWRLGDLAAIAPGRTLRGLGRGLPARPAPADAAGPVRHLHRRGPAPRAGGAGGGPVRGAGIRRLVPARRAGHPRPTRCSPAACDLGVVVQTGAAVDPDRRRRRAGARRTPRRRRAPGARPTWWWPTWTRSTVYRDLLPDPRRLAGLDRPQPRRLRAAARACAATPGWPTTPSSSRADYDAEFDAVFGDPGRGVPARPAPTRRSSSPWPTTRWSARTGTRPGSCWSTPPRHGTGGRGGLAPAGPGRRVRRPDPDVLAERGVDVRDRLLFREVRTPADLDAATGAPGGAIYGTAGRPAAPGQPRAGRTGCSWSAAPPIPAAGCRWSPCPAQIVADLIGPA